MDRETIKRIIELADRGQLMDFERTTTDIITDLLDQGFEMDDITGFLAHSTGLVAKIVQRRQG